MNVTFPASGSGVYAGGGCLPSACYIVSPFGDATTNYLGAVFGDSGVTITFAVPQHQLNLLWSTVDVSGTRDRVTFNFSDGPGIVTGADVAASFAGGIASTDVTVEITTAQPFTSVTLSSSSFSFEFVPAVPVFLFAGTPGKANCVGQSVSALTAQYGGLNAAAAALVDFGSVAALQNAIMGYCGE